jgi:hypothetical protein
MGYVFRPKPVPHIPLRSPSGWADLHNYRSWTWRPAAPGPQRQIVFFVWGFDPYGETQLDNLQYFWNLIDARDLATSITDLYNRELVLLMPRNTKRSVIDNGNDLAQIIAYFDKDPTISVIDVVGFSMGGLTAKYALQSMVGQITKVKSYFSYDTPHRGANVPLSVQYATDYLREKSDTAKQQLANINSDAAREALFYHYKPDWTDKEYPVRDPKRQALVQKFREMAVRKRLLAHIPARYAIANGDASERFPGKTDLGSFTAIGAVGKFWALASDGWAIDIWACGYAKWDAHATQAVAIDGMGGGTSDYMYTLLNGIYLGTSGCVVKRPMDQSICFVPNASAFDMQVGQYQSVEEEESKIDFADTCAMPGSTEHVSVHDKTKRFILDHLSN